MTFVCDRGCLTDGKPTKHANRAACPVIHAEREALKTHNVPQRTTDPSPVGTPASAPSPPAPEKSTWDKFVEFVREPANTVASPDVPQKQESYLLEGEDVVNFWTIILSIAEFALNLLLRFLEVKELPPDLMDIKKSKASSLLVSRNMRHTTSQLFISLGVRTKGEAQAIIGEGEGIVAFGHIFAGVGFHLMVEIPKSPKWKAWTEPKPGAPAGPSLLSPSAPGANAWWDPLGVFTKKADAPTAPAMVGATA